MSDPTHIPDSFLPQQNLTFRRLSAILPDIADGSTTTDERIAIGVLIEAQHATEAGGDRPTRVDPKTLVHLRA
ncbi:MAG: hypothetical protein II336_06485 [Loktanella sp.]|nr:hypothetical protein [Loktanella sp.]